MQKFFKDNLSVSFGSGTSSSEDLNKERTEDRGRVGGVESVWRDVDGIGSNIDLKKKNEENDLNDPNFSENNFPGQVSPDSIILQKKSDNHNNNNSNNKSSNAKITAHL